MVLTAFCCSPGSHARLSVNVSAMRNSVDLHLDLAALGREDVDVRLAEDDEQVALASVLQVVGHVQVGVHARLEHGDAAELVEFRGMGVVVEGAGNQHIEVGIAGLARSQDQIGAGDGAELRADEDRRAFLAAGLGIALDIAAFGADQIARPGRQRREGDLVFLVRLLHPGGPEVLQNHLDKAPLLTIAIC